MSIKSNYVKFRDHFFLYKLAHKRYEKKCQKHYRGPKTVSILSSNCVGGEVYHDLGLPFNSPTINLWMVQPDFLKFATDLQYYIESKLCFSSELEEKYHCPVAYLGLDDKKITIIFLHYKNRMSAEECWEKRKKRIDFSKICLMMSDRDGITYDDMIRFGKIDCYRKIMFTYKDYPEFDFTYRLEKDKDKLCVKNYQMKKWNGFWRWESQFDCAKWMNGDED